MVLVVSIVVCQCMGWSWYLANDMQFYIISPLILILFYSRLGGVILSVAFVLGNFISAGVLTNVHNFSVSIMQRNKDEKGDSIELIYIKPWTRIGPYIVGLLTGYILYKTKCKVKISKTTILYNATSRTVLGACVAWVIFACATGYGGPVNALLSWKGIVPLSRLTYCCYLGYKFLCITYGAAFIVSLAFESPMIGLEKVILGRAKNTEIYGVISEMI
ncbi:nose resistant to fluoxetine protein 6-like [Dreissena polymorpha]|uniref:nose resistant to fluoxetine protein 6-like n=1 Tax=Dreissena polymorpha TaxID=45954 RepID=UPI002264F473|nr:nose resistant to fluoxetine protein 6-like [Dreissena polymorpha]